MRHGVFITPKQRSIARRITRIHQAAEARSDNPFFWPYTQEELAELHRLTQEYHRAAWFAQVDAERERNLDGGEVIPF